MFEITGEDISNLREEDLRSLVGLLCEADFPDKAGITWGGDQKAADGGIDVRVELSGHVDPDGFVPRSFTGFQVKKTDMPRKEILKEMRPKDILRPAICELADTNGAYIIVSSEGWTSDSPLQARKKAMSDALADNPNKSNLKLDFYDRSRVATWVRCHPSLLFWVKDKIGQSIQGWRPFGNWANPKAESNEEYLLDDDVRLYNGVNKNLEGMNAVDGINALRSALSRPASSVRLAGLSGTGKTRLLQALFDPRIGVNPLPSSQVYYTDMGDSPNPAPVAFAERLYALRKPAILAVDNCPPELHKSLTAVCTKSGSLASLITVEYDVREDQPEETDVFRLEPASVALVEKLIQIRFEHISEIDARTIADFSGGNARIAIALANTVTKGETLAALNDEEIFKRLFHQRNNANDTLLNLAEVCALVYSFDCQTAEGLDGELKLLASLAETTVNALFRDVAELKRRDLVQQRNVWRAVLPHALANRLAQKALENIPLDHILTAFEQGGSERLLRSFSRRLSYLHKSEQAVVIAERWLSAQGLLKDVSNLNDLGIVILKNIAPVAPKATLEAIERAANGENGQRFASRDNPYFIDFTGLLRSLAYEAELFERCAGILCRFALSEMTTAKLNAPCHNSICHLLKSLFFIYRSGTYASANQRLSIIERLVHADSEQEQALGLLLLGSALETCHFSSDYNFDFGARSRDYGYSPETEEEVQQWFIVFINLSTALAVSEQPIAAKAKILLAEKFMGLWSKTGAFDALETMAHSIIKKTAWNEGWRAVNKTIDLDAKQMPPDLLSRLQELEALLKPANLLDLARAYVFTDIHHSFDLIDVDTNENESTGYNTKYAQIEQIILQLGQEVGADEAVFNTLLPELITVDVTGPGLSIFTKGLAGGACEPLAMWDKFCNQLSMVAASQRKDIVLSGFLNAIWQTNPEMAEQILNTAVSDEILGVCFPQLQMAVEIDERGVERLKQSLNKGLAPVWTYRYLGWGQRHTSISDDNLCDLLKMIASKPDGLAIAVDTLQMRLHGNKNEKRPCSNVITSLGQELLIQVSFDCENYRSEQMDYRLGQLAEACLKGEEAVTSATVICKKLAKALSEHKIYPINSPCLLKNLARQQPQVFLDNFLDDIESRIGGLFTNYDNPKLLSHIDDKVIIDWCEVNASERYPKVATFMVGYQHNEHKNCLEWTPLSLIIMNNAPDVIAVLNTFNRTFRPSSWSGSRADIMERGLDLILQLKIHQNPAISTWAHNEEKVFAEEIKQERQREEQRNRTQDERFE
ncbi:MAG: hypothetical protein Q8L15_00985 [Methylobacter sp.]|nr:hypothetical protein [Methylobacter sp.]